ncbi:TraB/GumN family protein [Sphingobium subterraneum]|uniref:TraB/GumN family protein n=1 Tax=Sphingobium subterraneum TaxID=627688 RepID=A0A841IVV8_9SPHN|nr:TraB/GumN family protein [Sphingobium subterraneum]MBB6122787.1 hypothetical protein [Sphingobium subterraneum]
MIRRLSSLISLGLLALAGCARAENTAHPASADPALWVVKDADTTIYLFGTVHMMKPGAVWFDDEIRAAFDQADELVTEIAQPNPAAMASQVQKLGANPTGPALSQMLSEKERARYLKALASIDIPPETLERSDPWKAAITLSILPLMKLGYTQQDGSETVLENAAKAAGKRMSGLETVEQQLGYFDTMPRPLQLAFLNATVKDMAGVDKQFSRLITDWSRGNVKGLAREMNSSLEETPELAKILLYDRNARWAQWIRARMAKPGTVFIAVGAGHLAGKGSVQEKLQALGLDARRIGKKDFGIK